jgi:hypothetical protein
VVKKILRTEEDKEEVIQFLNEKKLDKPLVVEVTVFRKCRSLPQNKLMWLWFRCIAEETGNDVDTLHDHFSEKFLGWNTGEVMGEYHRKVRGTSKLNTKEFDTFLEQIRMDMLENYNIHLPIPGSEGWDEFYEKFKHVETKGSWVEECQ